MPAWCTPIPARSSRESVAPKPPPKRKSPSAFTISALRDLGTRSTLSREVARSTASFWEKWTT